MKHPLFTSFVYVPLIGSSFVGAMPLEKRDRYPHVTVPEIKQVCENADRDTIPFIHKFETAFTRMPDERGISDQIALLIHSTGAGFVKFHDQRKEGKTGTDFLIEMHFDQDPAVEQLGATLRNTLLSVPGSSASGAGTLSGTSTPASGISSGHTTPGGSRPTRSKTQEQTEMSVEASRLREETKAKKKAEKAAKSAAAAKSKSSKRVVYIQAKSYHKHATTEERVAKFTYKGKQKAGEEPKPMQMNLLKETVKKGKEDYPEADIVGGYLLYDPEDIVFIPLDEIIEKCSNGCQGNDDAVDREMSQFFRNKHQTRKTESFPNHPCFMLDIASASPTTVA
ncbi:hypothetical protein FRB91_006303 [Serendipita sp. 411]|nr:hypothetical protein FRB91_006303 [Serendipita sp. 411]KAG9052094.1 hypothetical protein FS842_010501 [Serendipita sp. 407]